MLNDLDIDARATFYNDHGEHVFATEGMVFFHDGALDDGRLTPPPTDDFERAKIIVQYALTVANEAEEQFEAFKNYLAGHGRREPEWVEHLYTREDQLAYLAMLRARAKRKKALYFEAKRDLQAARPEWIDEQEQADIEAASEHQSFLSLLESFQL